MALFTAEGQLDPAWSGTGRIFPTHFVSGMVTSGGGTRIVTFGTSTGATGAQVSTLAAIDASTGASDPSFGEGGFASVAGVASDMTPSVGSEPRAYVASRVPGSDALLSRYRL